MKDKSILIEMERFLQEKKSERILEYKRKKREGELILIEMEKFLRKKR